MLDGNDGGGSAGTNWLTHDVISMWQRISPQASDAHDEVSLGWKRTAELTSTHLSRMTEYRDNLAAAWSPKKSKASAAYVAQLNNLIVSLTETNRAAAANYSAFSAVTATLASTRQIIEPLFHEYVTNQASISQWQADKAAAVARAAKASSGDGKPTPSPSPQASPVSSRPPVSTARQEQLNNLARAAMFELSSTIINGQAELLKPEPYQPASPWVDHGKSSDSQSSGLSIPPVIPAPIPVPGENNSKPHITVSTSPVTSGAGPILTGALPTVQLPTTPSPVGGPPIGPTMPGGLPGVIGTPSPLTPGVGELLPISRLPGSGLQKPRIDFGVQTPNAMPSGNVIGARPGSGMIGQMPIGERMGGTSPSHVNPVGGVIGSQPGPVSSTSANGRAGSRISATGGQPASLVRQEGSGRRRSRGEVPLRWDPDDPWLTDIGVDPVVLPPDNPGPIDPGPVIGRNR